MMQGKNSKTCECVRDIQSVVAVHWPLLVKTIFFIRSVESSLLLFTLQTPHADNMMGSLQSNVKCLFSFGRQQPYPFCVDRNVTYIKL